LNAAPILGDSWRLRNSSGDSFGTRPGGSGASMTGASSGACEPFSARAAGVDPIVFLLADYGYTTYSQVLMVSKKMIAEKPQVVQGFIDASIKGWNDFLNGDHSKGVALIIKDNPDYTLKINEDSIRALKENGIVTSGDAKTLGIGAMTARAGRIFSIRWCKQECTPPVSTTSRPTRSNS
jgi:NitT/TauT family transport system substrate-binding protein